MLFWDRFTLITHKMNVLHTYAKRKHSAFVLQNSIAGIQLVAINLTTNIKVATLQTPHRVKVIINVDLYSAFS